MRVPVISVALLASSICVAAGEKPESRKADVARRIAARTFPSVFQAWSPADNLKDEDKITTEARHDLIFHAPGFLGLRWDKTPQGLATGFQADSIPRALARRKELLAKNPNLVLLAEILYRDASKKFLPENHEWWMRDKDGKPASGWKEGSYLKLDFTKASYRAHVAARAGAVVKTGAFDGVMLDWWRDDDDRLALIRAVRTAVGDEAMILCNANDRATPRTAPYINGYFMECTRSRTSKDWSKIAATLSWAEKNLRAPRINCLETWYHTLRDDLNLMRATTTLALTHSDGYCLFSDPNPLPTGDHRHNWYPFWNNNLGKPTATGVTATDGTTRRDFENGTAIYNPMGNKTVTITLDRERTSAATGKTSRTHTLKSPDGDIYLKAQTSR